MSLHPVLAEDFADVVSTLAADWPALRGARLFITGGTGLIGRWMLEALRLADEAHDLGLEVAALTRDPATFAAKSPTLAAWPALRLVAGDVLTLQPDGAHYTHVIHGATDASADLNENDPLRMFDTIVAGTRNTLDFARAAGAGRVLFMSSGAVYGAQPWDVTHVDEDYRGGPDLSTHRSSYGEGKRAAEMLCAIYRRQFGLDIVTTRIFALLGPMLALDTHFAAGNFIRDAMAGRTVTVNSDGRAVRSYLYTADLTAWMWAVLLRAPAGATYNLGSEQAVSIGELAERAARLLGSGQFEILGKLDAGWNPGRYVPATHKIRQELSVVPTVDLDEAIRRTAAWNGWMR
ncbi:MAG: NAD-dependent epimerase/dehydratase family protein [Novosphingobium sp.]